MVKISINKKDSEFDVSLLKPKDTLFPEFWENNILNGEVSKRLLKISNSILKKLDLNLKIEDIILTGSICSYNWHEFSDIDLHVVLDFRTINEDLELVKRMLDQTRINWNKKHNILISGKEVELYFQDKNEPHESNGIWSLISSKWLAEPVRLNPSLDLRNAEKKAEMIAKSIEHLTDLFSDKKYKETYNYSYKIKSKISNMRKSGISEEGIYSPENLAFKMLRYSGHLERLNFLNVSSYDRLMSYDSNDRISLEEAYIKDYFSSRKDPEYMKWEGKYNIEDIMPDNNLRPPWGETEDDLHT